VRFVSVTIELVGKAGHDHKANHAALMVKQ
jgi:hypothetical protein